MKISIIGAGYVGLVTGACLADRGHHVTCVDVDLRKVDAINIAKSPIHEAELDAILHRTVGTRLGATTDLASAVRASDVTLIAVGTPFDGQSIDLRFIRQTAMQIGEALRDKPSYHVVVVKSTVIPGTTLEVVAPLVAEASGKRVGVDFGIGMNPEFLSEGTAVADFMSPDRIVIGGIDDRSRDVLARIYEGFESTPILRTNTTTAEAIKYASNALQATAISFANEVGNYCASLPDADVVDVMEGVHLMAELNPRAGDGRVRAGIAKFLVAGCGFGGSCFPKDVKALVADGQRRELSMPLLSAVLETNRRQPRKVVELVRSALGDLAGRRIAVLGLAFKPDTDDMRESPSIPIIEGLLTGGAMVQAYDPVAMPEAKKIFEDRIVFSANLSSVVAQVDAVVLVTRWEQFRAAPKLLAAMKPAPIFIDGRRMLDRDAFAHYVGIGMGSTKQAEGELA